MGCYHRLRRTLLCAIGAMVVSTAAESLAIVQEIDKPLPLEFRERATDLLKELRPADAAEAIQNTKSLWWPGDVVGETIIILRVEADCPTAGNCMTIIGRMTDRAIKPELTLEVRPKVLAMDVSYGLWGSHSSAPLIFDAGGGVGLVAVFREQGWVVSACGDCTNLSARSSQRARDEPEVVLRQSFEDFQRALNFHRN
ncbi:hypothetical protein [Bosea sp. (in: a-proteobacteria)]|uniref:hypothetical protein n=1 Tax=Bosea sp. (in: a-proteobacteria) TaxID=1871050 RepID=UPI002E1421B1